MHSNSDLHTVCELDCNLTYTLSVNYQVPCRIRRVCRILKVCRIQCLDRWCIYISWLHIHNTHNCFKFQIYRYVYRHKTSKHVSGQGAWEGFFRGSPHQMVTATDHKLDFGSCSRLSTGTHKTLTVVNSTNAKVTAFLVVPDWQGYGSQPLTHKVFQVCLPVVC